MADKTLRSITFPGLPDRYVIPEPVSIDATLSQQGKAADAKAVGDALKAQIAPAYSTSSTYAVGDLVLYNNALYRCKTAITTAEAWTPAHWEATIIGAELSQQKNAIDAKAPVIINTASGDVVSFADGADGMQIRKIVGTIVTPEGGSGWTGANVYCYGVNLFNKLDLESNTNHYLSDNGSFRVPGSGEFRVSNYIPVKAGYSYTLSNMQLSSSSAVSMCWYTADKTYIKNEKYLSAITSKTVTAPNNAFYARLSVAYSLLNVCQFELGDNATVYKSFVGNTSLIDWSSVAGAILNGTVTLNEDGSVDVVNSDTTDSYHLSNVGSLSTYYGTNNVFIDTGAITECDYPADTKLFLTARDTEIIGNIAPVENGTTASQEYAQGAYFWHDTKFCKALTAIASGATFTLNTNYTETTVAAELLAAQ